MLWFLVSTTNRKTYLSTDHYEWTPVPGVGTVHIRAFPLISYQ